MENTILNSEKYLDAVDSLIGYAEATKFNPNTGDFAELMNNWIKASRKLHADICNNKEVVIKIIKNIF